MINQSLNMTLSILATFAKTEPSQFKTNAIFPLIDCTEVDENVKESLKVIAKEVCCRKVRSNA